MHRPAIARRVPPSTAVPTSPVTPFWRIENKTTDTAELMIYDEVSFYGVTAADFAKDLAGVTAKNITLRLNSPGGDVFDGIAIANLLREHPATVTVKVDALAASIASVIAMAGDRIIMGANSQMMIHDAMGFAFGATAADMREMADLLDMVSDNLAEAYAARAGGDAKDWRKTMKGEQWYTAQEAVDAGLADEVAGSEDKAATRAAARWVAQWGIRTGHDAPAPVVERIAASLAVEPETEPAEQDPEPAEPVRIQPDVIPVPAPVAIDLDRFRAAVTAVHRAQPEAPLPRTAPARARTPKVDVPNLRDLLAELARDVPAPRPVTPQPVDLGPLPAPVPEPAEARNPLADLIRGAIHVAATDRPAPPSTTEPPAPLPPPPFALDVSTLRRAVREARY